MADGATELAVGPVGTVVDGRHFVSMSQPEGRISAAVAPAASGPRLAGRPGGEGCSDERGAPMLNARRLANVRRVACSNRDVHIVRFPDAQFVSHPPGHEERPVWRADRLRRL
jgi:hypothetical protein